MYIALDTSTDVAGVALLRENAIIAELTWRCGQNHTIELLPHLEYLLKQSGTDLSEVRGIIVALGPGSYNGLRVGVSAAKGLALALNIPIAGINTLEAAAYQHSSCGLPVCAVSGAGRGEIAAAFYRLKRGRWTEISAPYITTVEALCSAITTRTVFCGELTSSVIDEIALLLKTKAVIPPPAALLRRAGFLAELGLKRLVAGDCDNPAALQPLYLRRPPITMSRKP
jgi:tRNA threonylcarbamoyl adenosine modification protein YeaZ